jgi:chemotaxis protein CheZ
MGHSDAFPLPEALAVEAEAAGEAAVHVWGDTANYVAPAAARPLEDPSGGDGADIYHRVGHLTRTLHNALRELGYHDSLADARANLPDARQRLDYIARLTGDAAEKVLNSVDRARVVQDELAARALSLSRRWGPVAAYAAAGERATPAGQALVEETCGFLSSLGERTEQTNSILTEIMMAQDFHDLTGQVIRRVVSLSQTLEEELVKLLLDAQPPEARRKPEAAGLEGPVVDTQRGDVVTDQAGVDDLLASLGF